MTRRDFLGAAAAAAGAGVPDSILVHEHVLVDFGGVVSPGEYDPGKVFELARPKLEEVRKLGCRRFLDCTPNYLGRNPALLRQLSEATGVEIWTNTGIYGAADRKGVPPYALTAPAESLAAQFIDERIRGVAGLRPRFIKTGVPGRTLDDLDRKLVRAAAIASRETGMTIASHTGGGPAAVEQLAILKREKVSPAKFVWVHAQSEKDAAFHERIAREGAWVEFDALRQGRFQWQLECVGRMASRGLLKRTLIGNDAGWYHVGEPNGGEFLGYSCVYTDFLPKLDAAWHRALMVENPVLAFGK